MKLSTIKKAPMFKVPLLAITLALILAGGTIGIGVLQLSTKDYIAYQQLVESSTPQKKGSYASYSQQTRQDVNKEIWFQEKTPLHFCIQSEDSQLFFFHGERNKLEVMEEMQQVKCIMQEELFFQLPDGREAIKREDSPLLHIRGSNPKDSKAWIDPTTPGLIPMQLIRYFEAEKASYNYNSQLFVAEKVHLWKFRLIGHQSPSSFKEEEPLMTGSAESVEFLLKGKEVNFIAHQLKATFDPKKGAV